MKRYVLFLISGLLLSLPMVSQADDSFYGKVESRPDSKTGSWVIGGRTLDVTAGAELEEESAPLVEGACVKVEIEKGIVEEIETVKMDKCD